MCVEVWHQVSECVQEPSVDQAVCEDLRAVRTDLFIIRKKRYKSLMPLKLPGEVFNTQWFVKTSFVMHQPSDNKN